MGSEEPPRKTHHIHTITNQTQSQEKNEPTLFFCSVPAAQHRDRTSGSASELPHNLRDGSSITQSGPFVKTLR
jgi:hypothetical protein